MSVLGDIQRRFARLRRKGVSTHPELAGREHLYSSARTGDSTYEIDNYFDFATTYINYVWVRKAVGLIADNIAPLPVRVIKDDGKAVPSHPLTELFSYANDTMDPSHVWRQDIIHKLLGGESGIEIVPNAAGTQATELWPRRPDRIHVLPDYTRLNYPRIAEYVFNGLDEEPITIPDRWMVFDRFYNPLNVWRGISPIRAVREGITLDILGMRWGKSLLKAGAKPEYAITSEEFLTPDERLRLEKQVMEKHGSALPFLLDNKTKIQPFSWAPKDMEWMEQRQFSRDEVGGIFGVPDEIMGYGRDTYENFETALRVFWLLTLLPLIQRRDVLLTKHFKHTLPMLRPGERIATDTSSVGVLQDDDAPRIEKAGKLFDMGVPFNKIDERLSLGVGPIPGGEVGYLPATLLPADAVAAPLPPPQAKAAKAGRPTAQRTGRALQRIRKQVATKMETAVDGYFTDLASTVVARARTAKFAAVWQKAIRTKELPTLDMLILDEDLAGLTTIVGDYYVQVCEASWETWNAALGLDVSFSADNAAVVAALADAGDQVALIDEATKAALQELLQYAAEQGWTVADLVKGDDEHPGLKALIQETYKGRARTIARTELGTAQNKATLGRYGSEGVTKVKVFDNGDDDPDSACQQANGQVWSLKKANANLLEHPSCTRAFAVEYDEEED
jgi:HK97 family phage portal protein